jgi:hypothetical protein
VTEAEQEVDVIDGQRLRFRLLEFVPKSQADATRDHLVRGRGCLPVVAAVKLTRHVPFQSSPLVEKLGTYG